MKNTLNDLNNALFEQIERLQDDELTNDDVALEKEIKRSKAVNEVAKNIIDNGSLALRVKEHMDDYGVGKNVKYTMLGMKEFDWKKFKNEDIAVHCKEKSAHKNFREKADLIGIKWLSGKSLLDINYNIFEGSKCYVYIKRGDCDEYG